MDVRLNPIFSEISNYVEQIDTAEWLLGYFLDRKKGKTPEITSGQEKHLEEGLPILREKVVILLNSVDDPIGIHHISYLIGEERLRKSHQLDRTPDVDAIYRHDDKELEDGVKYPITRGKTKDGRIFFALPVTFRKEHQTIAVIGQKILNYNTWIFVVRKGRDEYWCHFLLHGKPNPEHYLFIKHLFEGKSDRDHIVSLN